MSDSGPFESSFSRGRSSAGQFAIACVCLFFCTGVRITLYGVDRGSDGRKQFFAKVIALPVVPRIDSSNVPSNLATVDTRHGH